MGASRFGKVWTHKQTSASPAGWFIRKRNEEQHSYGLTACLTQRKFTAGFCWQPVLPLSRGCAVMVPISSWADLLPVVILFNTAQQKNKGWVATIPPSGPSTPTVPQSAAVSVCWLCKCAGTLKHTVWMWMCVVPAQAPVPSCFWMQGAGEKRLPNFPCQSTCLHAQMLITPGACMGQSARLEEQLVHLPLPPQVPVSTVTPPADNKDNHLRFPTWLIFSWALLKGQSAAVWFSTLISYQHTRAKSWAGGGQIAPPATHSPEGDRSVRLGGGV